MVDVRFFVWNEALSVFKKHPMNDAAKLQSPGFVIIERGEVLYKHIVTDITQPLPTASTKLAQALSCPLGELTDLDEKIVMGLENFLESYDRRESFGAMSPSELQIDVSHRIGGGVESDVFKCYYKDLPVAVKCYKWKGFDAENLPSSMPSFAAEAAVLMALRHQNVLHVVGFGCDPPEYPFFLVTELLERGSLFNVLKLELAKRRGYSIPTATSSTSLSSSTIVLPNDEDAGVPFDAERRRNMLLDIARGMAFLHTCSPPVIHQDLKSLNVLVARDWTCKIADFGIATSLSLAARRRRLVEEAIGRWGASGGFTSSGSGAASHASSASNGTSRRPSDEVPGEHGGTKQWMAPELMVEDPPAATTKTDIFAFGVVMWEIATCKKPWLGLGRAEIKFRVSRGERLPVPDSPEDPFAWPVEFHRLVDECWNQDPSIRPEFRRIVKRLLKISIP
ncbi:kinase-like domain-containing protein [Zopfochytrium polystomum]|nr:kinase-like domain-containing protein [Zopfochytrium polystomum]